MLFELLAPRRENALDELMKLLGRHKGVQVTKDTKAAT